VSAYILEGGVITARVTDNAASLTHYEVTGRHVPNVNTKRNVCVKLTGGDKAHV